jgi:tellurite resistance protein TerC
MLASATATESGSFVDLSVSTGVWAGALGLIAVLLLLDILVIHRVPKVPSIRRAALETVLWIGVAALFGVYVLAHFGGKAGGEWFSGYLIEYSLSIDNVFVWAIILMSFAVPAIYQHRVLFWGVFGALVLRAVFIIAGVSLVKRFDWILYLFGAFLLYTAFKLAFGKDHDSDPTQGRFMRFVRRVVPMTDEIDGQHLFTRIDGKRVATPLFAVLLLVEFTDLLFAVDSVPAVLAVSHETFIVFTSNAFAIMGLRSLYFLLADMRTRFSYLQQGLAVILAFVGVKMLVHHWYTIPTPLSLIVIALVLVLSVGFSMHRTRSSDVIAVPTDGPDSGI